MHDSTAVDLAYLIDRAANHSSHDGLCPPFPVRTQHGPTVVATRTQVWGIVCEAIVICVAGRFRNHAAEPHLDVQPDTLPDILLACSRTGCGHWVVADAVRALQRIDLDRRLLDILAADPRLQALDICVRRELTPE